MNKYLCLRSFLMVALVAAAGCGGAPSTSAPEPAPPEPKKDASKKPDLDPTNLLPPEITDKKFIEARTMVIALGSVLEVYRQRYNEYPTDLNALVTPPDGGKPLLLKAEALKDPWGRFYQYDPTGPKNKGKKPDVWSQGPNPADPAGVIANW